MSLVFSSRSAAKYAQGQLDAAYFSNEIHKKLAKLCYDAWSGASAPEAAQILLAFDEAQAGYVTQVLMDRAVYSDEVQAAKGFAVNNTTGKHYEKKSVKKQTRQ